MVKRVSGNRNSMEERVKRMEEMAGSPVGWGLLPLASASTDKQVEILAKELAEEREKLAMARKQQTDIKRIAQEVRPPQGVGTVGNTDARGMAQNPHLLFRLPRLRRPSTRSPRA